MVGRRRAWHCGNPGRQNRNAFVIKRIHFATKLVSNSLSQQPFPHRTTASVSGADNQRDKALQFFDRLFVDHAFPQHPDPGVVDFYDRRRFPKTRLPIVENQIDFIADALSDLLPGDRIGLTRKVGTGQHNGPCTQSHDLKRYFMSRYPQPNGTRWDRSILNQWIEPVDHTVGMIGVKHQCHRTGPAASCHPAGKRRHIGNIVQRIVEAFNRERERIVFASSLDLKQFLYRLGMKCARRQTVNGFGWNRDYLSRRQSLNCAMNHITRVFFILEINNDGSHAGFSIATKVSKRFQKTKGRGQGLDAKYRLQ